VAGVWGVGEIGGESGAARLPLKLDRELEAALLATLERWLAMVGACGAIIR